LHAILGDIGDEVAIDRAFAAFNPQVVFHAAAYKHVPMLQYQAREAVRNNVIGTVTLSRSAIRNGCERFVLISTDKAVNPSSVMGATKRLAEMCCEALNGTGATRFITVRFGNVLGSAGSVVPLFQEQIRRGGPVTVTHPEMTRYFMTIPEAAQLILQAAGIGAGGEIFVLDMGEPVRITYLAEQLIRLSGRVPGDDIRIEFTGTRPGERLHEELFHQDERLEQTTHHKIMLARHRRAEWSVLERALVEIRDGCERFDEGRLNEILNRLVPEMSRPPEDFSNVITLQRGVS
jgi:FlaA1/EpsC-like NDP-sugar epimerase